MKPQCVVDHEHFFAFGWDDPKTETDDINGRYDACLTKEDESFVWSPASGMSWKYSTYDKAKRVAEQMANYYLEFWSEG